MTTKHTPGPWINDGWRARGSNGECVNLSDCGIGLSSGIATEEAMANGCLCLAAPELLEALQGLLTHASGGTKQCVHDFECVCPFDAARAAVAKATGESE